MDEDKRSHHNESRLRSTTAAVGAIAKGAPEKREHNAPHLHPDGRGPSRRKQKPERCVITRDDTNNGLLY